MSRAQLLVLLAAAALGVLAWDLLRSDAASPAGVPAMAAKAPVAARAPSSEVSAVPGAPADMVRAPNFLRPAQVSDARVSPLARAFAGTLTYKPIYERLKDTPEGATAEGQYYLYRILRACATVADRRRGGQWRTPSVEQQEERRKQILASLPEGDPRLAQRLAAYDKVTTDPCAGLAGLAATEAELDQLLKAALAGGDPKARAWQVEQEMWQERRASGLPRRAGATLSDDQLASIKDSFSSRDPEAIAIAGRVLANSFRDLTVRIGPDREVIENRAFLNAAQLLACEYGYPCGDTNAQVLNACAYQGHCGVASLPDYLFYYGASPYDAQLLDRYRTLLRQAVDTGDWSALQVDRGSRSPNAPSLDFPGRPIGR